MIYYFSGTGNSLHVARQLADRLCEQLSPIVNPVLTHDKSIGLVFPVYSWGIPSVVDNFIRRFFQSAEVQSETPPAYVYALMTCGDDVGYADRVLDNALLSAAGRKFDAVFSVQMPNTYVCLPGFDVDSDELCKAKLNRVQARVSEIAELVAARRKAVRRLKRGIFPFAKTYVVRPLFNRFLVTDKYFHVDASKCVSCGRCRKSCPVGNILLIPTTGGQGAEVKEVPKWMSHCSGCLACYHSCPHHAINFGNMTAAKGQYSIMKQLHG